MKPSILEKHFFRDDRRSYFIRLDRIALARVRQRVNINLETITAAQLGDFLAVPERFVDLLVALVGASPDKPLVLSPPSLDAAAHAFSLAMSALRPEFAAMPHVTRAAMPATKNPSNN